MGGVRPGLIIAGWLVMMVSAIANGTIGEFVVKPRLGEYGSHVYKTVVAIAVTFLVAWLHARWTAGPHWKTAAWACGAAWLVITVGFEFGFGHYVMGHPWEKLLADYRVWEGRLWPLLLAALLFAPVVTGRVANLPS